MRGSFIPFTVDKFDEFFRLLPDRADSERSWIIDIDARKRIATEQAKSLSEEQAKIILNAVYNIKAVNPNRKVEQDTRTPAELIALIEEKQTEIMSALLR